MASGYARPVPAEAPQPRSSRGEQTRELILATALRLFREHGYDATTMRVIAREAGVSVGNAYYYFDSKEHLIQAFYGTLVSQHLELARPRLAGERELATRLRIAVRAHLELIQPYHAFAGGFFKTAADPTSPLSPFSSESTPARADEIAFFAEVVDGAETRIPKQLRADLPELLWLYHMGVVMYWVHDTSDGLTRTLELVDRTAPLVVKFIGLARLPGTGGLLEDVLDLLHSFRPVR
jgi:AcrR family transcriptional regulator